MIKDISFVAMSKLYFYFLLQHFGSSFAAAMIFFDQIYIFEMYNLFELSSDKCHIALIFSDHAIELSTVIIYSRVDLLPFFYPSL